MYQTTPVSALPAMERPTARLHYAGGAAVSQTELLAVLIGGPQQLGIAQRLVCEFGESLPQITAHELQRIPGIGPAIAARIQAALELGHRCAAGENRNARVSVRSPGCAANVLIPLIGRQEQEHFVVLYLDIRNRIFDRETVYKGTVNTTVIRLAELFRGAVRRNAAAIIIAHNHPSGDANPSPEDIALTRRVVEAGQLMQVEVLDHLIIGSAGTFVSLRERGIGFEALF